MSRHVGLNLHSHQLPVHQLTSAHAHSMAGFLLCMSEPVHHDDWPECAVDQPVTMILGLFGRCHCLACQHQQGHETSTMQQSDCRRERGQSCACHASK